jgi:RsiW-degrading membrane proteinase PrsW (M82 family)
VSGPATRLSAIVRATRAASAILGVLVAVLACAGCGVHPAGTNDVRLTYAVSGSRPQDLAALARARLSAAEIVATVSDTTEGVEVSLDRDEAESVDALLTWRGGLAVYELASDKDADARELAPPPGAASDRSVRVREPARVDLSDAVDHAAARGQDVEIRLSTFGASNLDVAARALGSTPVVLARGTRALLVGPLPAGAPTAITLSMGHDLVAYAQARRVAALLSSSTLPAMKRTAAAPVPTSVPLLLAGTGLPALLSFAWLFFVRRFDRAQPEPWWLVLATFGLGCVSVVPAAFAELAWVHVSPWLDPSLVTMGGALRSLPIALPVFALVIGLSEEGSKFLGTWALAFHRREFDEPVDGIVYGAASALGFAAVENVKYFAVGRMTPALVVVRMFMSVPAHLFFGAIWGYALGRTLVWKKTRVAGYVLLAALLHGAFDAFLSYPRLTPLAFGLNLLLATLFVLLLRQSLRHGVVTLASGAVDPNRRLLFAVGSGGRFAASAIALHVLAAAVFVTSAYAGADPASVGAPLIVTMTLLVTMLGACAWALSATMPLDAVIDDHGVTFAGATRAWQSVSAVKPARGGLLVSSSEGDLWIGPAAKEAMAPLATAIMRRAGSKRM